MYVQCRTYIVVGKYSTHTHTLLEGGSYALIPKVVHSSKYLVGRRGRMSVALFIQLSVLCYLIAVGSK